MDRQETVRSCQHNATLLADYFRILNSGDETRWERAFADTWHPDAIILGQTFAQLRAGHRDLLGKGWFEDVDIVQGIEGYKLEYTAVIGGKHDGPFWATFKDGRIYRVL